MYDKFMVGDIIFRQGDAKFQKLIGTNYTHAGIIIENEKVHDLYKDGLRNVDITTFVSESYGDNKNIYVFRIATPQLFKRHIEPFLDIIKNENYNLPNRPRPFNIFSSSEHYNTTSCIKYLVKNLNLICSTNLVKPQELYVDSRMVKLLNSTLTANAENDLFENMIEPIYFVNNTYSIYSFNSFQTSPIFTSFIKLYV